MLKRWRQRRDHRNYLKLVKLVRAHAERHRDDGHMVELDTTDQSIILFRCNFCPDLKI